MNLNSRSQSLTGSLSLVLFIGLLLFGLWPLDFHPENDVEWLRDANGIHFSGRGMVRSHGCPGAGTASEPGDGAVSIEIYLRADMEDESDICHILTLDGPSGSDSVLLGQWKSHLIIRSGDIYSGGRRQFREFGLSGGLRAGHKSLITITSDDGGMSLYVDGKLAKDFAHDRLPVPRAGDRKSVLLVLGNSPTANKGWVGSIYGLSFYDGRLSEREVRDNNRAWKQGEVDSLSESAPTALYAFDEREGRLIHDRAGNGHFLSIPSNLEILKMTVLAAPWNGVRLTRSSLSDIVINVLGFIPFGFVLSAFLGSAARLTAGRRVLAVMLCGGVISLSIELLQALLPARDSSLVDLVCNLLGAATGACIFAPWSRRTRGGA